MKNKSKLKVFLTFFLIVFMVVNFIGFSIGNFCHKQMCLRRGVDNDTARTVSKILGENKKYDEESVSIKTTQGYKLSGTYIKNPKETKDTMILVHGLARTRKSMLSTARLYLDKGFNVLVYDSRNNGESEGKDTTYGHFERYDLDDWVHYISKKNPGGNIGVHGRSMGAATALMHSELNEKHRKVKFYISDCSYSDLKDEFLYVGEKGKLSIPLEAIAFCASTVTKLKSNFKYSDVSPKKSVQNVSTPIMFIHGAQDELVPVSMCKELFDSKNKGLKEIYIAENAGHGESFKNNREEYKERVYEFVDAVLSKNGK
ncbi:alpha/beta hydrolase [Anaerosalibacter bizertensis]|uniref:Alpha/beta hydrolase n=1 Tax=Anaerosalibacter bizertensis TaxID=932217 RepID=A0A9Q4FLD8_9FIRM|nr:alpha/beta hydrolase [Anaerosalibacter bizertensis]MBV1818159.1 alpha/beta hydrolase [Bacteroidales bacterium MSK.15.36]MCB5559834.1 alpha/beta hydrolase [Anaerosalibacter bizertensis]MCG4564489.1 alpha/beta hydrolase [Anaerosalibacter bizertensis]MCG4581379.1 alpha/beta hydrolase [Anaerosalibacter bizertensis]MCG4584926.1 alpha/beta hydrolase [Anaerosalibacter bizertensis]